VHRSCLPNDEAFGKWIAGEALLHYVKSKMAQRWGRGFQPQFTGTYKRLIKNSQIEPEASGLRMVL
jgi:hypothetical protein